MGGAHLQHAEEEHCLANCNIACERDTAVALSLLWQSAAGLFAAACFGMLMCHLSGHVNLKLCLSLEVVLV